MTEEDPEVKALVKQAKELIAELEDSTKNKTPRFHSYVEKIDQQSVDGLLGEREDYLGKNASMALELGAEKSVSEGLIKDYPKAEKIMKIQNREVVDAHGGIEEMMMAHKQDWGWLKTFVPVFIAIVIALFGYYILSDPKLNAEIFNRGNENGFIIFGVLAVGIAVYLILRSRGKKVPIT